MKNRLSIILLFAFLLACKNEPLKEVCLLNAKDFTVLIEDKNVSLFTLESGNGIFMQVTNFGAHVVSLFTPDRKGNYENIIFGYENINGYLYNEQDSIPKPMDIWDVERICSNEIVLSYIDAETERGCGTVRSEMTYTLTSDNELKITFKAITDKLALKNISHQQFFNLKGEGNGKVTNHVFTLNADYNAIKDAAFISAGSSLEIKNIAFDFTIPTIIGKRNDAENELKKCNTSYKYNWVVGKEKFKDSRHIATLYEPTNGRVMEVWSEQPIIQFGNGDYLDSLYHSTLPLTKLDPNEMYTQSCIYKFLTK